MGIDDETLMRYADGELNEVARARVGRALAVDAALAGRLDEYRELGAKITAHYTPVAAEDVPERLSALLAGNVVAVASGGKPASRSRWIPAIAASLAAGLVAGQLLPDAASGPLSFENGAMIARGDVARALDMQLASAQPADAAVRIGVSFPGAAGRACRTFETVGMAGVACRARDQWRVLITAAPASGRSAGSYAQAGSADAVIMQAAQDMMTGEPLDAAAERRARDAGWARGFGRTGKVGGDASRP